MERLSNEIRSKTTEKIEMTEKVFDVSLTQSFLSGLFDILKEIKAEQNAPHEKGTTEKDDLKYDFLNQKNPSAKLNFIFEQIKKLSQIFKYDTLALDKTDMPFSKTDLFLLKKILYLLKDAVRDVFNQDYYQKTKDMVGDDAFFKLRLLFILVE